MKKFVVFWFITVLLSTVVRVNVLALQCFQCGADAKDAACDGATVEAADCPPEGTHCVQFITPQATPDAEFVTRKCGLPADCVDSATNAPKPKCEVCAEEKCNNKPLADFQKKLSCLQCVAEEGCKEGTFKGTPCPGDEKMCVAKLSAPIKRYCGKAGDCTEDEKKTGMCQECDTDNCNTNPVPASFKCISCVGCPTGSKTEECTNGKSCMSYVENDVLNKGCGNCDGKDPCQKCDTADECNKDDTMCKSNETKVCIDKKCYSKAVKTANSMTLALGCGQCEPGEESTCQACDKPNCNELITLEKINSSIVQCQQCTDCPDETKSHGNCMYTSCVTYRKDGKVHRDCGVCTEVPGVQKEDCKDCTGANCNSLSLNDTFPPTNVTTSPSDKIPTKFGRNTTAEGSTTADAPTYHASAGAVVVLMAASVLSLM